MARSEAYNTAACRPIVVVSGLAARIRDTAAARPFAGSRYFWMVTYRADALIVMLARCASLRTWRKN
jgi:hypothetical protein